MSTVLRNQFTATSTKQLKSVVESEDSKVASGKWSDTLTIEDGINKFRLFPKHPGEEAFTKLLCRHWLSRDVEGEEKRMTVPNSKVHGDTEKDIIEEYTAFVKATLSGTDAEDAAKIKSLTAYPGGIGVSNVWVAYANKITKDKKEFGLLEIKKMVRDALNNAAIIEDESEAIDVDPFTDPDKGILILITYNSKAKKASDYYKLQLSKTSMPLTDEELEAFSKVTPLSQLPQLNYTINDFENALEGLQYFDDAQDINLFDTEEFQAIIEEVKGQYDEAERKVEGGDDTKSKAKVVLPVKNKATVAKSATKKPIVKTPEPEEEQEEQFEEQAAEEAGDQFDEMDRTQLKQFIVKNGLRDVVKVYQNDTDEQLRVKIRATVPFGGEEVVEEKGKFVADSKKSLPSLSDIKNRLAKNKNR